MKKHLGIGLMELILSLAVLSAALLVGLHYYQTTSASQRVNQAANDMTQIFKAFETFRLSHKTQDFTMADLSPFLPDEWGTVGSDDFASTANPWGGAYEANSIDGTPSIFTVTATEVVSKDCSALVVVMNAMAEGGSCAGGGRGSGGGTGGSGSGTGGPGSGTGGPGSGTGGPGSGGGAADVAGNATGGTGGPGGGTGGLGGKSDTQSYTATMGINES